MLDIKLIREHPEIVKESQKNRGMDQKIVDEFLKLDKEWRELKAEVDTLRSKRNKISEQINEAKKQKKDVKSLVEEAKEIPKKLESKEKAIKEIEEKRDYVWREIPNIADKSIPIGDASKNKTIKEYGKIPKFKFKIKDHADILEELDLLDTKKQQK
jgi:seryl-tRNA synthetase